MKKKLLWGLLISSTQLVMGGHVTGITKITFMYTYETAAVIKIQHANNNEDDCSSSKSDKYFQLNFDSAAKSKMYSAMLAAFISGQNVRLAYDGCVTWGSSTIPEIYRVDLSK